MRVHKKQCTVKYCTLQNLSIIENTYNSIKNAVYVFQPMFQDRECSGTITILICARPTLYSICTPEYTIQFFVHQMITLVLFMFIFVTSRTGGMRLSGLEKTWTQGSQNCGKIAKSAIRVSFVKKILGIMRKVVVTLPAKSVVLCVKILCS